MWWRLYVLAFLLCGVSQAVAQEHTVLDSLQKLELSGLSEREQLEVYNAFCDAYWHVDPQVAI
ncbi:hypothetical protein E1176_09095 [Fulvivirga sp. RKSG066]|uniref:hypothetical protein n=1 Tax=Fulvivirga aurantia TaxID=2529383 RepID=UPI0012BBFC83|nr:hypothetical protein [Fulvivirga aurantia]MTI21173.1 hypothetical protein [Fulvivirga aurantia]